MIIATVLVKSEQLHEWLSIRAHQSGTPPLVVNIDYDEQTVQSWFQEAGVPLGYCLSIDPSASRAKPSIAGAVLRDLDDLSYIEPFLKQARDTPERLDLILLDKDRRLEGQPFMAMAAVRTVLA